MFAPLVFDWSLDVEIVLAVSILQLTVEVLNHGPQVDNDA
jgi:hypothetical protein